VPHKRYREIRAGQRPTRSGASQKGLEKTERDANWLFCYSRMYLAVTSALQTIGLWRGVMGVWGSCMYS